MGHRRAGAPPISLFSFQDIITSVTGIMILVTLMMSIELVQRRQKGGQVQPSSVHVEPLRTALVEAESEVRELTARRQRGAEFLQEFAGISAIQLKDESHDLQSLLQRLATEAADLKLSKKNAQRREDDAQQIMHNRQETVAEITAKIQELRELIAKIKKQNRVIYNPVAGTSKTAWLVEITGERIMSAQLKKTAAPLAFDQASRTADFLAWAQRHDRNQEYFVLLIKPSGVAAFAEIQTQLKRQGFDLGFDVLAADQTAIDPVTGAMNP